MNKITILSQGIADVGFVEEWYDLATEGHFWMDWRLEAFSRQLKELGVRTDGPWKGLDIGCGSGVFCQQLEKRSLWTVDGTDLNKKALSLHQDRKGATFLYDIHDRKPELAQSYDFVVLFDVLEHIDDTRRYLESALYHLKPGGWLFINVPALQSFYSAYDRAAGHLRRYNKASLRAELERFPLDIRDIRYWGMGMLPMLAMRSLWNWRQAPAKCVIENGFQPPSAWINNLLKHLMRLETSVVTKPWVGTSLLAAACKRG